jgi:hypothetical protein
VRIAIFEAGAAHSERLALMEFDLLEMYLNAGLDHIHWPFDGHFEARLYTGGRISPETFVRRFLFLVYGGEWKCAEHECDSGWFYVWHNDESGEWVRCDCVDELELVVKDWK